MASSDDEPFDCSHCYHLYDSVNHREVFWDESDREWYNCDRQPCPNRESEVVPPDNYTRRRRNIAVAPGQVCRPLTPDTSSSSSSPASEHEVEDILDNPTEAPVPTPLPSIVISPPTPTQTTLPPLPALDLIVNQPDSTDFVYSFTMSEAGMEKSLPQLHGQ